MTIHERLEQLRSILKIEEKKDRIKVISEEMNTPDFWLNEANSRLKAKELKSLEEEARKYDDLYEMSQIATEEEMEALKDEVDKLEIYAYFNGKYDHHNAILNFFAGAGGDDAQDWTEMLLRMYLRWAENNGVTAVVLDESRGNIAGLKSATVELTGDFTYGKLKGEFGVHRLVRQSPFNAKALRQTSFALVEVMPDIETETEVKIDPKDLKIDVFHSGGAGGQSVNTTDSAVRVKHLPTGITVSCQNERSQLQNKEVAMRVLRSKLVALLLQQQKEKIEEIRGDFSAPEWGNQIRSYVLHPYKMVKDHRTDFESKNPDAVLGGDINGFIESELKYFTK